MDQKHCAMWHPLGGSRKERPDCVPHQYTPTCSADYARRMHYGLLNYKLHLHSLRLLPLTKEEVHVLPVFVCLSVCVCLSVSKITQKCVHGYGCNVACRQMSEHGRTD